MRVIAAIRADLEESDIGTRSRAAEELGGVPILVRTVQRALQIEGLAAVYVLCPAGQRERCGRLLAGAPAVVRDFASAASPWRSLIQGARKWSLDGWRGGIGGTTCFDEFTDLPLLDGLLRQDHADAVLSLPAAAPLLSTALARRMIEHRIKTGPEIRLVFAPVVPGLAGILLDTSLIRELAEKATPVGTLLSYKPDAPRKDLIFQPSCLEVPAELRFATGRLIADTDRALERIRTLVGRDAQLDDRAIGQSLIDRDERWVEPLPREVELELTTDDAYPDSLLRPRAGLVGRRGPIAPALARRVVQELVEYDDSLVVLGGFGDPLRHPQFDQVLDAIRPVQGRQGAFGVAVRTSAVDLTQELAGALVRHRVDVLNVLLDAWTAAAYGRLHSPDAPDKADLEAVLGRVQMLADLRRESSSVTPVIVPEFCKARDNVHELDAFFDGWLRRMGAVNLVGFSHYGRRLDDRSVADMRPPVRTPCRRIRSRCLILADGSVTMCDQDFLGRHVVGRIGVHSLREIWQSAAMGRLRAAHETLRTGYGAGSAIQTDAASPRTQPDWATFDLCANCDEWHRP